MDTDDDCQKLQRIADVLLYHYAVYNGGMWEAAQIPQVWHATLSGLLAQALNCVEADIASGAPERCWCFDTATTLGRPVCWLVYYDRLYPDNCAIYCMERKISGVPVGAHTLYCLPPGSPYRELFREHPLPRIRTWLAPRQSWKSVNELDAALVWLRNTSPHDAAARIVLARVITQTLLTRKALAEAPAASAVPVVVRETWRGWFVHAVPRLFRQIREAISRELRGFYAR